MKSEYFTFDGIKSSDMDIYLIKLNSGYVQSPIRGSMSIKSKNMANSLVPSFFGVEKEVIEFQITVALMDEYMNPKDWTPQDKFKVGKWILGDRYKPFQTADDLGKVYYAMCINDINSMTVSSKGYIDLTFRTNSHCAWSPVYIDDYDLSTNLTSTIIQLENRSNVLDIYKPKVEIKLDIDTTSVSLKNLSNGGKVVSFIGLTAGETVSIDNQNRIVLSNLFGNNPFSKKNNNWIELVYGVNQIEVTGKCRIQVKSQFPIAQ